MNLFSYQNSSFFFMPLQHILVLLWMINSKCLIFVNPIHSLWKEIMSRDDIRERRRGLSLSNLNIQNFFYSCCLELIISHSGKFGRGGGTESSSSKILALLIKTGENTRDQTSWWRRWLVDTKMIKFVEEFLSGKTLFLADIS